MAILAWMLFHIETETEQASGENGGKRIAYCADYPLMNTVS
jgi:hypothetical protein